MSTQDQIGNATFEQFDRFLEGTFGEICVLDLEEDEMDALFKRVDQKLDQLDAEEESYGPV